jgi:hypothetical protein
VPAAASMSSVTARRAAAFPAPAAWRSGCADCSVARRHLQSPDTSSSPPDRTFVALLVRGTACSVARSLPCRYEALLALLFSRWDSTQPQRRLLLPLCTCHHRALGEDARGGRRPHPGVQIRQHAELPVRRPRFLLRPAQSRRGNASDSWARAHNHTLSSGSLRSWHLGLDVQQVWHASGSSNLQRKLFGRVNKAGGGKRGAAMHGCTKPYLPAAARNARFTMRSSRLWKLITASRPPAAKPQQRLGLHTSSAELLAAGPAKTYAAYARMPSEHHDTEGSGQCAARSCCLSWRCSCRLISVHPAAASRTRRRASTAAGSAALSTLFNVHGLKHVRGARLMLRAAAVT